jgi:hypothetical protein
MSLTLPSGIFTFFKTSDTEPVDAVLLFPFILSFPVRPFTLKYDRSFGSFAVIRTANRYE